MATITPTRAGEYFAASRDDSIEGTIEPLERELTGAYDCFQQQAELIQETQKVAYYRTAVVAPALTLLAVLLLWLVV